MDLKKYSLPAITLGAGSLGCALRFILYLTGFDEKHILPSAHPLQLLCLALTLCLGAYLFREVRRREDSAPADAPGDFRRLRWSPAAALLLICQGVSLLRESHSPLFLLRTVLTFGAAAAMITIFLVYGGGRRTQLVCRGLICLFFALDMLCRYRSWSGNPQLQDYIFQVPACMLLCLANYHRLAWDTGLGSRKILRWCCLMALYLCLLCIAGPDDRLFYLGSGLWAWCCTDIAGPIPEPGGQTDVSA